MTKVRKGQKSLALTSFIWVDNGLGILVKQVIHVSVLIGDSDEIVATTDQGSKERATRFSPAIENCMEISPETPSCFCFSVEGQVQDVPFITVCATSPSACFLLLLASRCAVLVEKSLINIVDNRASVCPFDKYLLNCAPWLWVSLGKRRRIKTLLYAS